MKSKIISLLCIVSMLLSVLVGCGAPGNSGDPGLDGNKPLTDEVKNRMTLAKELADEVDGVRSITEAVTGKNVVTDENPDMGRKLWSRRVGESIDDVILLNASKTAYTRDEGALDKSQGATNFEWADQIVTSLKNEKAQALEVCKCLNTWVKMGDGPYSAVYRMNYDANTDTVIVEYHSYPSDQNTYRRFTVTLDSDGKAVIDSYSSSFTAEYIQSSTELHYYEDKYYFSLSTYRNADGQTTENTMFLDLENNVQAYLGMNSTTYYENGVPVRTEYKDPEIRYEYTDGDYIVIAGAEGGSLSYLPEEGYSSGGYIGECKSSGIVIDINIFEGWTTLSRVGDNIILNTTSKGEISSLGFTANYLGEKNGVSYTYMLPYYDGYETASLWVSISGGEGLSTKDKIRGAFDVIASELGLAVEESLKEKLINAGDRHSELSESFHFKNGIYGKDIKTPDDYFALLDMMRTSTLTLDELNAVYDGTGILRTEQIIDNTYFEFLDFTLSGSAALNAEVGELSLAGISAGIEPSILLIEGGEYSLVFAWSLPGELIEIGSASAVYDNKALSFVNDLKLAGTSHPTALGEYRLVAFIAIKKDGSHNRISKFFDVTASASAEYVSEGEAQKCTLTASVEGVSLVNTAIPTEEPTE